MMAAWRLHLASHLGRNSAPLDDLFEHCRYPPISEYYNNSDIFVILLMIFIASCGWDVRLTAGDKLDQMQ
jgi:hypothetical protein